MSHVYVESTVDLNADVIDVRDIIARVLELRDERDEYNEKMGSPDAWDGVPDGEPEELAMLEGILSELAGYGGDAEFDGDCYPVELVAESYFQEYAQNLAEDCGMVDTIAMWPMTCIDWKQAACELQMDYNYILIHDTTYWYR
jgi:hypothetical protein